MSMNWGQLSSRLVMNSLNQRIPLIGEFELTPRCNLKCKMCYICRDCNDKDAISRELSDRDWIRLALEARDLGMLFILLTGGEVFLRKDFKTIYDEISMMGFNVSLYTNGTMITPQVASWLGNHPPSQIEITLYGASPETYHAVCGDSSGFHSAIRGIELLINQGINVQLRTTIVKGNVHDFEALAEIAGSYGLPLGIVNYVSPRREGTFSSPEAERLSPKDLADFEEKVSLFYEQKQQEELKSRQENKTVIELNELQNKLVGNIPLYNNLNQLSEKISNIPSNKNQSKELISKDNFPKVNPLIDNYSKDNVLKDKDNSPKDILVKNDPSKNNLINNNLSIEKSNKQPDKNYSYYLVEDTNHNAGMNYEFINNKETFPCTSGKNSFWMTWDGRMVPCSMMNKPEAFPLKIGVKNAWRKLGEECKKVPACKTCSKCSISQYCNSCPAGLMNETGSFTKISSYLCELAQERKNKENELRLSADRR